MFSSIKLSFVQVIRFVIGPDHAIVLLRIQVDKASKNVDAVYIDDHNKLAQKLHWFSDVSNKDWKRFHGIEACKFLFGNDCRSRVNVRHDLSLTNHSLFIRILPYSQLLSPYSR